MQFKQFGNIKIDVEKMKIDMLSLSGHKIYAPKGVGALYIKEGIKINSYLNGGYQEFNKRAGTENVANIVGLGEACVLAKKYMNMHNKKLIEYRDYIFKEVSKNIPNVKINGSIEKRLPGNCNFSFDNIESGELLLRLDEIGICASGGSACSSNSENISHVLKAIEVEDKLAKGALRITLGDFNTSEDVEFLVRALKYIVKNK